MCVISWFWHDPSAWMWFWKGIRKEILACIGEIMIFTWSMCMKIFFSTKKIRKLNDIWCLIEEMQLTRVISSWCCDMMSRCDAMLGGRRRCHDMRIMKVKSRSGSYDHHMVPCQGDEADRGHMCARSELRDALVELS